jgi:hypothetical protein
MVDIGVVVHGPEVIDSGNALIVLTSLESLGRVTAVLGGTMGRVAVIDTGLENVIDISQRKKPSESIRDMQYSADLVVLLNQAKTRKTGLALRSRCIYPGGRCFANSSDRLGGEVCSQTFRRR